jgi:molybdopterin synthase sulfur carrier subunit
MKTVKLFATLRDMAGGKKQISVPFEAGQPVRELVHAIAQTYPEIGEKLLGAEGDLSKVVHIYVRGRNVEWLDGLDTIVGEQDEVILVPPAAGG